MDRDYTNHEVRGLMPGHAQKALKCFKHNKLTELKNQLHPRVPPKHGAKVQHVKPNDTLPPLDKSGEKFIRR